ncbi:MAG: AbrB/MazE/SpoVT family DNA-binding domain-containing protein [Clostridia bacterium]|nr:AbrB/MazE/SpoVT family DNA-binding domain-containing protein [Clostridia bacterium]
MIYTNFREIDKAGRIVISKDIRTHLNINPGDVLQINANDECITIKKAEEKCVFCNSLDDLHNFEGKHICSSCLKKLKEV